MEKTLNILDRTITILFSILLIILLACISILPIAKSKSYYMNEHEKNDVKSILEMYSFDGYSHSIYENNEIITHIHPNVIVTNDMIETATDKIIDYLYHEKVDTMQFYVTDINDNSVPFFSDQAIIHMEDVKVLFIGGIKLCFISLVLFILSIIYIIFRKEKIKKYISKTYIITVIVFLILTIIIGIFACIDFDTAFIVFHYIIFPDSSKAELAITFNSCDTLTNVLTGDFFVHIGLIIGITFVSLLTISIIICILLNKYLNKFLLKLQK